MHAYRGLPWNLALTEVRGASSTNRIGLGILWALAQPVLMMMVVAAVFSVFVKLPVEGAPTSYSLVLAFEPAIAGQHGL